MAERTIKTYAEFWPYYLGEHAHPLDRRLHFIGTTIVIALAVTAILTRHFWLFALMPVAGYGFAWFGHFVVEKNRPATFTYPFWSLGSDFVMWKKIATGQIDADLQRYNVSWPPRASTVQGRA